MSTIHDRNKSRKRYSMDSYIDDTTNTNLQVSTVVQPIRNTGVKPDVPDRENNIATPNGSDINEYVERANDAMSLVNDIVLKNYLSRLSDMEIVESSNISTDGIILYKINKMVYEKDEYATDKFISAVSAMTFADCSIFLIVDGHKNQTDFYLGVRCDDDNRTASSVAETFVNAIRGQFPGIQMNTISCIDNDAKVSEQDKLFHHLRKAKSVSSCVGIPSVKTKEQSRTNSGYIQGIEKLALAMRGKEYTAIILAQNSTADEIMNVRSGYENLYTQLSAQATQQLSYATNESLANAYNRTKGYSDGITHGISHTDSKSNAHTVGKTQSTTTTKGESKSNAWGKVGKIAGPLNTAGAILTATGLGAPLGLALMGLGATATVAGAIGEKNISNSTSHNVGSSISDTETNGSSDTTNESNSHQENFSETDGQTSTIGSSKNFTLTVHNKNIEELLKRIDIQLQRIKQAESLGLWQTGTYFLSYDNDRSTAETAATIFRSIMQGENSGVETSAINSWYLDAQNHNKAFEILPTAISNFTHPVFSYNVNGSDVDIQVTGTSLISSSELAMMMGLPRKSVPGFPVIEHAALGKEVVKTSSDYEKTKELTIGNIFDQGEEQVNPVSLSVESLTGHTFVTGATGSGKSETIYSLINGLKKQGKRFLVIEPAKGEYKKVFGNANVFGTNPKISKLLHINPFKFPKEVHVLEHIDRIIEIFNACWPMYAAMPAILKDSILAAYESIGWDMFNSENKYSPELYPTFADVLAELKNILNNSEFHDDAKGNYKGALETRIKSLTNGIVGEIFSYNENGDEVLFDEDTIIDISRIGSQETKALIMGILIMRLNEYRMSKGEQPNSSLKHVTVLEEAHNILKNSTANQNIEGGNVAAKAVEMISNSIAEMRTYGEGFIIADQSPNAVDISAIRNTNTKIIMRLPETEDRQTAGKASAMKDNQIDEIAKLPTGVAVVYQNNWEEPVLCKITKSDFERVESKGDSELQKHDNNTFTAELLKFFLQGRIDAKNEFDLDLIKREIVKEKLPAAIKIAFFDAAAEYEKDKDKPISLWSDDNFVLLSSMVTELFDFSNYRLVNHNIQGLENAIIKVVKQSNQIPENLHIVICQCILRRLSLENNEWGKIYDEWMESKKKNS